jgi:hypothetical protein
MDTTKELPELGESNVRLFEIECDCCGRAYDADLPAAIPHENGRLIWVCPNCGCPSKPVSQGVARSR